MRSAIRSKQIHPKIACVQYWIKLYTLIDLSVFVFGQQKYCPLQFPAKCEAISAGKHAYCDSGIYLHGVKVRPGGVENSVRTACSTTPDPNPISLHKQRRLRTSIFWFNLRIAPARCRQIYQCGSGSIQCDRHRPVAASVLVASRIFPCQSTLSTYARGRSKRISRRKLQSMRRTHRQHATASQKCEAFLVVYVIICLYIMWRSSRCAAGEKQRTNYLIGIDKYQVKGSLAKGML